MATAALSPDLPMQGILQRINRETLESFIEAAITLLDLADGDCDFEPDNEDACLARDDRGTSTTYDGYGDGRPGDPADAEEDDPPGCQLWADGLSR